MFSFQNCPPKTVILEHWHQNWKEWIDGETDRLVMEAGGRDITPFSDWFSMTPQLYNRPFSCFNFPFSWSLTSLCKSHHHTHLLPQMFEVPARYFLGGSKCFQMLWPNLERLDDLTSGIMLRNQIRGIDTSLLEGLYSIWCYIKRWSWISDRRLL